MTIAVKICGLTTPEAVDAAAAHGADYAGFIFFPASPRHVSLERAASLRRLLPPSVHPVAVTVDADDVILARIAVDVGPEFLQLHGNESPGRVWEVRKKFGLPVIKALPVATAADLDAAKAFADSADMLLFDAKSSDPALPGGTGTPFDWALLGKTTPPLPWFLSGGLSVDNINEALRQSRATLVDVSSSLEITRGVKDPKKIEVFMKKVKH